MFNLPSECLEHPYYESWRAFNADNPHVYGELVTLAREARASGYEKWSIAALFEIRRWNARYSNTPTVEGYKMTQVHASFYARIVMFNEKDLRGFFNTRSGKFWPREQLAA